MTKERTALDKLIEPAIERVVLRESSYFRKSEVVNEVTKNKNLASILGDLRAKYPTWKLDQIILRYVDARIGGLLQQRDANGIRVYECYGAGESERRWMRLRAMTADTLRVVMQETRTQARQLEIKGSGYEFFLDELEKLGRADATVDEIYEQVVPKIREYRSRRSA